jgi:hypothetical protein
MLIQEKRVSRRAEGFFNTHSAAEGQVINSQLLRLRFRLTQPFPLQTNPRTQSSSQTREPVAGDDHGHQASHARLCRARHRCPVPPGGGPGAVLLCAAQPVRGGDAAAQRDLRRRAQGGAAAADHVPRHARAVSLPGLWRRRCHFRSVSSLCFRFAPFYAWSLVVLVW